MSKIYESIINRFVGISDDPRIDSADHFAMARHFDTSNSHRLTPLHGTEAEEDKTYSIKKFVYAPFGAATTWRLYGYGIKSGGGSYPALYIYDVDGGIDTTWGTPANNESTVNTRNTDVFFYYKNYIYMWSGGSTLVRFDALGLGAFNNSYQSISYTNVCQPVHHKADDVAYFFSDNKVHSLNNTSWTSNVLTLPSDMYIAAASQYGNYLAIVCNPLSTQGGNPVVYLWDRDSSLATLTERIDAGQGAVRHIAELNGQLILVTDFFMNNTYGFNQSKLIIKRVVGNQALTIKTLPIDNASSAIYSGVFFVKNDRLYFPAKLINDGDTNSGIYSVDVYGHITMEVYDADCTSFQGIHAIGNQWWIAHSGDGSVNRTVFDGTFGNSSSYETQKINGGDSAKQKKLIGVSVMTDPMPTAGSVTLKYRKDEETSWTTIFTNTTDNSISHDSINIESSGATLPVFKELQLQITSTGGAIVTGLKFKYKMLDNNLY